MIRTKRKSVVFKNEQKLLRLHFAKYFASVCDKIKKSKTLTIKTFGRYAVMQVENIEKYTIMI